MVYKTRDIHEVMAELLTPEEIEASDRRVQKMMREIERRNAQKQATRTKP